MERRPLLEFQLRVGVKAGITVWSKKRDQENGKGRRGKELPKDT